MDNEEKLNELRNDIIDKIFKTEWKEVWFFQERNGVKGFLGTQDIIFLCLNPSWGHFPSKYDENFYEELRKNNFENAHITDLIKRRATNEEIDKLLKNQHILNEHLNFLKREIGILSPKIIVTLGRKCDKYFTKNFQDKNIKIIKIRHYSSIRFPKNKQKFAEEMESVKNTYAEIL